MSVILHPYSKDCIHRTVWCWKTIWNMGFVHHLGFWQFWYFVTWSLSKSEFASAY